MPGMLAGGLECHAGSSGQSKEHRCTGTETAPSNILFLKLTYYTIMTYIFRSLAILPVLALLVTSCDKDEVTAPVITDVQIGSANSLKAYPGGDLHVEANILAEGKIAGIRVLIHEEGEHEKGASTVLHTDEWEYDSTYTESYANLRNATFHEHIEIPSDAEAGEYHFHLYVTDQEGNQTLFEEELEVAAPAADGLKPTVAVTAAPAPNVSFARDGVISISGKITDVQGLAGVYIGLVKESQQLADSDVGSANTISLLHIHDFEDPKSYSFSASIKVGATKDNDLSPKTIDWTSGSYYIVVKSSGVDGEVGFSGHYPITLNINQQQ